MNLRRPNRLENLNSARSIIIPLYALEWHHFDDLPLLQFGRLFNCDVTCRRMRGTSWRSWESNGFRDAQCSVRNMSLKNYAPFTWSVFMLIRLVRIIAVNAIGVSVESHFSYIVVYRHPTMTSISSSPSTPVLSSLSLLSSQAFMIEKCLPKLCTIEILYNENAIFLMVFCFLQ